MELQVLGHAGARVLVFPTSLGSYSEWTDRRMDRPGVLGDHLENGWIQMFCLHHVHEESWYGEHLQPGARAWRHLQYDRYLRDEVIPCSAGQNPNPFVIAVGASFGAYHAACFGLRNPHLVNRIIGLSGLYDITRLTGGHSDANVYACNPFDFMRHEHDRSEEHTSELQSRLHLVCRLLLEKKKNTLVHSGCRRLGISCADQPHLAPRGHRR